jgi:hypothetical protein
MVQSVGVEHSLREADLKTCDGAPGRAKMTG